MTPDPAPLKCLVADDEPQIGGFLRDALARYGYDADVVTDGEAAARKCAESDYALVVSDVMMPHKTGVELVRELRGRNNMVPIVLMSSFLSDEVLQSCSRLDHLAFLQKPFALGDLKRAIERAISPIRC
jgi:DNA-binding response OmpR family regulator